VQHEDSSCPRSDEAVDLDAIRRIYNEGHTVGTHSQDHPLAFQRLSLQRVEYEVDDGIASVDSAIGDAKAVAPFFRIPGLGRSKTADDFLASQSLVTWSADVVADDWFRGISAQQIVQRAMRRLDAKGRGILLLHDIHPATAMALPTLLKELKEGGYHVVQVVPAGERPASVPVLVAAGDKGAWPRVLKTSATVHRAAAHHVAATARHKTALRHHIKKHNVRHAGRKRHMAANAPRSTQENKAPVADWRENQY